MRPVSGVHQSTKQLSREFFSGGDFPPLAGISADISKGNLPEPDRQFEYLLLRHAHVVVVKWHFLSTRESLTHGNIVRISTATFSGARPVQFSRRSLRETAREFSVCPFRSPVAQSSNVAGMIKSPARKVIDAMTATIIVAAKLSKCVRF